MTLTVTAADQFMDTFVRNVSGLTSQWTDAFLVVTATLSEDGTHVEVQPRLWLVEPFQNGYAWIKMPHVDVIDPTLLPGFMYETLETLAPPAVGLVWLTHQPEGGIREETRFWGGVPVTGEVADDPMFANFLAAHKDKPNLPVW